MYLFEFFRGITRKSNIPIWIYLLLNIFIIAAIIQMMLSNSYVPYWKSLTIGIVLYAISIAMALSPLGEWILRLQTGCKKIKRMDQINRIQPLFDEVFDRAKQLNPTIPDNIQLYINSDEAPNAFATGRKTICVTNGLLYMPDSQIQAALGHELGHLVHKDTDLILIVSVGNFIITFVITAIRFIINFLQMIFGILCIFMGGQDGAVASIMNLFCNMLINLFVTGFMWLWTKIGILLVMKSSRKNEYEADQFSYNLGYGNDLCILLDSIGKTNTKGLFANLSNSHPDKNDRISRLQELGTTYRKDY